MRSFPRRLTDRTGPDPIATTIVAVLVVFTTVETFSQSILTFAGGATEDGVPATLVSLRDAQDVAVDHDGNLYIADTPRNRVRRVDRETGVIRTVAGDGGSQYSGDDGPATLAGIGGPVAIDLDESGNLFIAALNRIRRVDAETGMIATIAGTGELDTAGDGGPATAASLVPSGVAVDSRGNVFVADDLFLRVRRIDGQTGIISTVIVGGGTRPVLDEPRDVAIGPGDELYVLDREGPAVYRFDPGSTEAVRVAGNNEHGFSGDGGPATAARLNRPRGLAADAAGNLFIADTDNFRARRVDAGTGTISTIAGTGRASYSGDEGPAAEASLAHPIAIAADPFGDVLILSDEGGRVRHIDALTGVITTFAGSGSTDRFRGDGGPATASAFQIPVDVATNGAGNLFIADTFDARIRRVDRATDTITTFAKVENTFLAADSKENVYVTKNDVNRKRHFVRRIDGKTGSITVAVGDSANSSGFSGDGGPASQSKLNSPAGLAVDAMDNLIIADRGNNRVRRVDATSSIIQTIAGGGTGTDDGIPATTAKLTAPVDVSLDGNDNLFILEDDGTIRRVDGLSGLISTVARFSWAVALAASPDGALLVSSFACCDPQVGHHVYRIDDRTGEILQTFADGIEGFRGDNGPATRARINEPSGIVVDHEGFAFLADLRNGRIRVIPPCAALGRPSLLSPSDGSSGLSTAPQLSWTPVPAALRYDVLLGTTDPPTTVVASDVATSSFSPANLQSLTTYYWKVVAKGDPYCEPSHASESDVRSFTTANVCAPPD